MGHTEMLLAVAGLEESVIEQRNRRLSSGDWSSFSRAERVAFSFADKHARNPASVTDQDFRRLASHFGPERALDLVWWSSHCHYMTRVADAFQLPLERENVFDGFRPYPGQTRGVSSLHSGVDPTKSGRSPSVE